jgi:hypothetical protein
VFALLGTPVCSAILDLDDPTPRAPVQKYWKRETYTLWFRQVLPGSVEEVRSEDYPTLADAQLTWVNMMRENHYWGLRGWPIPYHDLGIVMTSVDVRVTPRNAWDKILEDDA